MREGMEEDKGENETEMEGREREERECCPFVGFLPNWVKEKGFKNDSYKLIHKVALQSMEHSQRQESVKIAHEDP